MGADSCIGGGMSFVAPFNLAMINPLSSPHVTWWGVMLATSKARGMAKEGASCAVHPPQPQMPGVLDQHFQIPEGCLDSHSGSPSTSLTRGRAIGKDEQDKASLRPYRPSALDPATTKFYLLEAYSLQAISFIVEKVACCNNLSPWKESGDNLQGLCNPEHSHETTKHK